MENLRLNDDSLGFLRSAAKWARLLAVVGLVVVGLAFVSEIFTATLLNSLSKPTKFLLRCIVDDTYRWVYLGLILVVTALCALPMIYLYCFANKLRRAIGDGDTLTLAASFRSLKRYFLLSCVMTIMVHLLVLLHVIMIVVMFGIG